MIAGTVPVEIRLDILEYLPQSDLVTLSFVSVFRDAALKLHHRRDFPKRIRKMEGALRFPRRLHCCGMALKINAKMAFHWSPGNWFFIYSPKPLDGDGQCSGGVGYGLRMKDGTWSKQVWSWKDRKDVGKQEGSDDGRHLQLMWDFVGPAISINNNEK